MHQGSTAASLVECWIPPQFYGLLEDLGRSLHPGGGPAASAAGREAGRDREAAGSLRGQP